MMGLCDACNWLNNNTCLLSNKAPKDTRCSLRAMAMIKLLQELYQQDNGEQFMDAIEYLMTEVKV